MLRTEGEQMNLPGERARLQRRSQPGIDPHTADLSVQDTLKLARVRPLPWRTITRDAVGIFLVTRLAYAVATYFIVAFSLNSITKPREPATLHRLLEAWLTGDARNYLSIATYGYTQTRLTAFFPLYPLLIHVFALGHSGTVEIVVALLLANLGTLAALIGLGLLAAYEYGPATSVPAIRALIVFPLAFFLAAGYADNLFLALVVFAFLCARRGMWGRAIAYTFVSALLRPTGLTLTLPLLWEYGRQQGWWRAWWAALRSRQMPRLTFLSAVTRGAQWQRIALPLLLIAAAPAGVALFAAYCWRLFGNPLIFLQVQASHFQRVPLPLPNALLFLGQSLFAAPLTTILEARNLIDLAPFVLFLVLSVIACARRLLPGTYVLYLAGVFYADLAAPLVGNAIPFPSVGRHMLLAVPLFLLLGKWSAQRPWLEMLLVSLGLLLQGAFLVAVMHGNLSGFNAID